MGLFILLPGSAGILRNPDRIFVQRPLNPSGYNTSQSCTEIRIRIYFSYWRLVPLLPRCQTPATHVDFPLDNKIRVRTMWGQSCIQYDPSEHEPVD